MTDYAGSQTQADGASTPESSVETVVMNDQRKVEFAGKRRMLKESLFDTNGHPSIRIDFRNGETRVFRVPETLLLKFAAHGAEQKIGDAAAGEKDVDDMVMAIDSIIERLEKGEWTVQREGGGFAGASTLARALAELSGKPLEEVKTKVKGMSKEEKALLRGHAKVQPIIARLEAEKAAKTAHVDPDALLAGFAA